MNEKYKLMVVVERADGSLFRQSIKLLTQEEFNDNSLVSRLIQAYKNRLGDDYFIIDYYFGY